MKVFIVLSAIIACALASGYLGGGDLGGYGGGDLGGYGGGHGYGHVTKVAHAIVKTPIYKTSYVPHTVHTGTSHHSYPVQEHRFTRSDYETPGATYAIPAVKTIQVTRPGYTTYIKSSVTKAHVTNHQVKGPTYHQPIVKTVVNKVLVPVHKGYEGHGGYGGGDLGGYGGGDLGGY